MSPWDKTNYQNSVLALKSLRNAQLPDISDYDIIDHDKLEKIELAGVTVKIRPELYLKNKYSGKIGAVKIHIAKTENIRLNNIGMQYAATIIKY